MNTIAFTNSGNSLPDFERLANSIKTVKRGFPAVKDGSYTYFADTINGAAGIVDGLGNHLTSLLTSLPRSLDDMQQSASLLDKIGQIDDAEQKGQLTAEKAGAARTQLQGKFNEALSSTLTALTTGGETLSGSADGLVKLVRKIEVRANDAHATEIANQTRAKANLDGANARLKILDNRLSKLNDAVDEKRGGPTEDLLSVLPDKDELTSLMDLGAEDVAAPELAIAKKSVEIAMNQLEKVLKLVDKTIEFERLRDIRDKVFAAREAQGKVVVAAQATLDTIKATLGVLSTVTSAKDAMTAVAEETTTLSRALGGFAAEIQGLDGQQVTAKSVTDIVTKAKSYLTRVQKAYNDVTLG